MLYPEFLIKRGGYEIHREDRGYMRNLNTNRAYEDLRSKRVELRQRNEKPTGFDLAETLTRYSEKGQAYVDTLKSIIKKNELDIADNARLRDEQLNSCARQADYRRSFSP